MGGCSTDKLSTSQQNICIELSKQCDAVAAAQDDQGRSSFTVVDGAQSKKYEFKNANICHVAALGYAINQPKEAPKGEDAVAQFYSKDSDLTIRADMDRPDFAEAIFMERGHSRGINCHLSLEAGSRFLFDASKVKLGSCYVYEKGSDSEWISGETPTDKAAALARIKTAQPTYDRYREIREKILLVVQPEIDGLVKDHDEKIVKLEGSSDEEVIAFSKRYIPLMKEIVDAAIAASGINVTIEPSINMNIMTDPRKGEHPVLQRPSFAAYSINAVNADDEFVFMLTQFKKGDVANEDNDNRNIPDTGIMNGDVRFIITDDDLGKR